MNLLALEYEDRFEIRLTEPPAQPRVYLKEFQPAIFNAIENYLWHLETDYKFDVKKILAWKLEDGGKKW